MLCLSGNLILLIWLLRPIAHHALPPKLFAPCLLQQLIVLPVSVNKRRYAGTHVVCRLLIVE